MTPTAARRVRVRELLASGMSYGRIASVVGVSKTMARKDALYQPRPPVDRAVHGRRGAGLGNHRRPLPEPTDARPGTPEKLAVLAHRAVAGNELWHPDDAT